MHACIYQTCMVNCPHMETERRCTRPREVQRNNSAETYYENTREFLDTRLREIRELNPN